MRTPTPRLVCAVLFVSVLGACQQRTGPATTAARVFINGAIYTADAHQSTVTALAVSGDSIVFVGDDAAASDWIGDDTRVIDLQGKRVLPGLHDAHVHPLETIRIDRCDLASEALDLNELATVVAACLVRLAIAPGEWLIVKNWNFADGNKPAEGLQSLRAALDRASTDNPILLENSDSHHFATNSAGLARAHSAAGEPVGLSATTLVTHFAELAPYVGLDARGEPNGVIHETVYQSLGVSRALLINLDALIPAARQMPGWFNSRGITSLLEAAFYPELAPVYDALVAHDALTLRVSLAQHYELNDFKAGDDSIDVDAVMVLARATREKYRAAVNIKADQLKYFIDGVLEGDPLAVPPGLPNAAQLDNFLQAVFTLDATSGSISLTGYVDPESEACTAVYAQALRGLSQGMVTDFLAVNGFYPSQCQRSAGVMFQPVGTTLRFIEAADANDFSVHFHAIGDRAVRVATDAIAAVTKGTPATNRHSIAHAQLARPEDIERIAALNIPVAFTYSWAIRDFAYDLTVIPFIDQLNSLEDMYNSSNYYMQQAYPARSLLDAGGVLAGGSDAPVISADPMPFQNIEIAITRDGGEGPLNAAEGIDILDAIDAYTIGGARLMRQADITGSLEAGKKADFVILDRDLISMARAGQVGEISEIRVLETWFDGRLVYRNTESTMLE